MGLVFLTIEATRDRDSSPPQPTEDERDRRTLLNENRATILVAEAQIVKDRVSNRSKEVGYVDFKSEESVVAALQLTGQKLPGIPVIVQMTETMTTQLVAKHKQERRTQLQRHPQTTVKIGQAAICNVESVEERAEGEASDADKLGIVITVTVVGISQMQPSIKDLLLRLTPILRNRHEKVQENAIDIVGCNS
ncbi:hypothetical protein B0T24DRAFT_670314 [Lasiosphaeria ovina]|uniref:RRM domain-containing protein n=1 Tax=Lasiosphaeria ovina TaxID=92902 RepID=A0AAE0JXL5_9PEZI|nr:hypothetical protein B0T24DRAFT_670314 [Lasiosphaeria ovina]